MFFSLPFCLIPAFDLAVLILLVELVLAVLICRANLDLNVLILLTELVLTVLICLTGLVLLTALIFLTEIVLVVLDISYRLSPFLLY